MAKLFNLKKNIAPIFFKVLQIIVSFIDPSNFGLPELALVGAVGVFIILIINTVTGDKLESFLVEKIVKKKVESIIDSNSEVDKLNDLNEKLYDNNISNALPLDLSKGIYYYRMKPKTRVGEMFAYVRDIIEPYLDFLYNNARPICAFIFLFLSLNRNFIKAYKYLSMDNEAKYIGFIFSMITVTYVFYKLLSKM